METNNITPTQAELDTRAEYILNIFGFNGPEAQAQVKAENLAAQEVATQCGIHSNDRFGY